MPRRAAVMADGVSGAALKIGLPRRSGRHRFGQCFAERCGIKNHFREADVGFAGRPNYVFGFGPCKKTRTC